MYVPECWSEIRSTYVHFIYIKEPQFQDELFWKSTKEFLSTCVYTLATVLNRNYSARYSLAFLQSFVKAGRAKKSYISLKSKKLDKL